MDVVKNRKQHVDDLKKMWFEWTERSYTYFSDLSLEALRSMVLIVKPSPPEQQVPPNPWPGAFSRRDFKLGMSLQEFKQTPFADKDKDAGAFSVCSDEAKSKDSGYETAQLFSDVFQKSGMIKCAFFFTDSQTSMVFDAGLGLADTMVSTEFYFLPDDSLTPRLFWIQTSGPADMVGALVPVMVKAYGEPQHTVEIWQNQAGGKFDSDVYVWTSPSSQITLKHFGSRNTVFDLKHTLKPLDEKFARILDQQNAEAAKKL
ncbi:hypothetical protein FJ420_31125 [Mesorhizobium sp. B3-1-3]|uniref:hypothetical protein n=1 Tax=unclassified Mesorhizobium TaxID=325217 RepID=UPI00112E17E5|nr:MULTISPECIES: hypothetical protein [unclassified Mesorhizobium]TPI60968.1 hypothetical protein FJ420_31125 [Mesorhizobium sp. B3-1-3]TPI67961.1 hypothetical protein FJ424_08320 [Mesorhizobium sp. B3-1-8]